MIENISRHHNLDNYLWIGYKPPPVEELSLSEAADVLNARCFVQVKDAEKFLIE